ncbi:peptidoglycan-binding protein [Coleofasciculus sp. E1-EBD-02]|uniref:peptidoglycan-binding protein n=1 Tax=Coleofasciculus sp. E1-EBD-02 TaxID=3068481 RepID=UPI0032F82E2C
MQEAQQKKPSFIPPAPAPKDSATGFTPPRFPVQSQAKQPSALDKTTRAYSSYDRDLIQAKLLEGMDKAIQRQTQTEAEAIQPQDAHCEAEDGVQLKDDGESVQQKSPQDIAADGFRGTPRQLPHLDKIQQSFGQDLSHVQAYMGQDAAAASQKLGAAAYTSGNRIAFAKTPSVGLAAHEAAHVMQQQSGKVQLKDGLGQVGDKYEQHADAVADAVVAGKSAKPLLGEYTKSSDPAPVPNKSSEVVQSKCSKCETHKDTLLQAKANQSQQKEFSDPISKATSIQYQVDSDKNSPKAQTKQRSLSPECQESLIEVGFFLGLVRRSQAAAPVLTRRALTAAGVSQVDTPAPGPGDMAAIALFLWGLYEAGSSFFNPPDDCPKVAESGIGSSIESLIPSTGILNNRPSTPSATSAPSLPSNEDFAAIAQHFNEHGDPYNLSQNVRRIKQFLGLTPVDGNYGPTTARTVYRWQQNNGLTPDGEVGANTWSMMFPFVSPTTASSPSATSASSLPSDDDFKIIVRHFNENGHPYNLSQNVRRIKQFLGLTPVDGNYGLTTARTVYQWQQNNGLTADGEVGLNTWSRMFPGIEPYQLTESTPPIETSLPASAIEGLRFLLQSLPPEIKEKLGGEANYLPLENYYTQLLEYARILQLLTPEQLTSVEILNLDPPTAIDQNLEELKKKFEKNFQNPASEPVSERRQPRVATDEQRRNPMCGPDVKQGVVKALNSMKEQFRAFNPALQARLCGYLTNPKYASNSWDIIELHEWSRQKELPAKERYSLEGAPCATPSTECDNSVEVDGKCYHSGSVNYVVYGVMFRLCRDAWINFRFGGITLPHSPLVGAAGVWYHKGPYPRPLHNPRYLPGGNFLGSELWMLAGYLGWPQSFQPPSDKRRCRVGCGFYGEESFTVKWQAALNNQELPQHNPARRREIDARQRDLEQRLNESERWNDLDQ